MAMVGNSDVGRKYIVGRESTAIKLIKTQHKKHIVCHKIPWTAPSRTLCSFL